MTKERRILVLEDDAYYRRHLERLFEAEGCEVVALASAEAAIASLREQRFAAAVLDWQLGGNLTGTDVLREISRTAPDLPVIMITSYMNLPEIASAYKIGILDYLHKPVQEEKLLGLVRRALDRRTSPVTATAEPAWHDSQELIGESPVMQEVKKALRKFGPTDAMVLLEGESGTGKEVAARALHEMRNGAAAPFEAINCGGIPGELIESELFGHTKGAFTGALAAHRGIFDRATGGTAFLDEIGELPLAMQAKLLRVLDTREYRPVGGETVKRFSGKVIFATNRNLRTEAAEGRFRADLYSRISEVVISMPPLRWRGPDNIELLARHFLSTKDPEGRKQFSEMALNILCNYPFSSGNVRQLRRYVFRAFYHSEGDVIEANDLPLVEMAEMESADLGSGSWLTSLEALLAMPFKEAKACLVREFERRYIEHHFRIAGFHIGRAAKAVELSEKQLSQKLSEYGLQKPEALEKKRTEGR
ncbi:MAG: sigma-54-dependent transcriptional regulator [Thermoanaerobaculia bacterium]